MSTWNVLKDPYVQNIILIGENGDQKSDTMRCVVIAWANMTHLQYPRSLFRDGKKYKMIKYSEKQDLVFYRLRNHE